MLIAWCSASSHIQPYLGRGVFDTLKQMLCGPQICIKTHVCSSKIRTNEVQISKG